MKVPELPCIVLQPGGGTVNALENIYLEKGRPKILFVEGLDMLTKKQTEMDAVSVAVARFREMAEHYQISIIGTVGCPKMKPKDRYVSVRDRNYGSSAWSRMADTIVELTANPDQSRTVEVGMRNAPDTKFVMEFRDGLLIRQESVSILDPFLQWLEGQTDEITLEQLRDAALSSGIPARTLKDRITKGFYTRLAKVRRGVYRYGRVN
jgi:hypothetical protein